MAKGNALNTIPIVETEGTGGHVPYVRIEGGLALTDRSGTITAGGTAQVLAPANASRRYLFVENLDPTLDLWINFTATAVVTLPSIKIPGNGGSYEMTAAFCSSEAVTVISTSTGHAFTAKEG